MRENQHQKSCETVPLTNLQNKKKINSNLDFAASGLVKYLVFIPTLITLYKQDILNS